MSDDRTTTLRRIRETLTDDSDEDQPSAYALEFAEALVSEAYPLPRASAAPWEDGSIYIYWTDNTNDRRLSLRVPGSSARDAYMYHREGADYGIARDITPAGVAEWLRWFVRIP